MMEVVVRDGSLSMSRENVDISLSEPVQEGDRLAVNHIYQAPGLPATSSRSETRVLANNIGVSRVPQRYLWKRLNLKM